jgi:hypothetical protein
MDPLSLVRDFNTAGEVDKIVVRGDMVDFGGRYEFPKTTFTAFHCGKDYLTLEAALHALRTRALSQAEYIRNNLGTHTTTLSYVDRRVNGAWRSQC